ncbi:SCO family protein [Leptospira ilyithenensis]|uniref:SCO family protein n=1 Tax=Leptospira ilyithenensis TaxID=2484901 RepID=UPI003CCC776E
MLLIVFLLLSCDEQKSNFYPELTFASVPEEGVLPYFKGDVMDPYWQEDGKNLPQDLKKIPDFTLRTHENKEFNLYHLKDKYTLVTFFYAKCNGICPLITRNILNFLPKIDNQTDVQVISISVNPEIDTVDELKKFRGLYKITRNNWTFLTGSKDTIYDMARKQFGADVKVIKGQSDLNDFVHTENVYLLDKNNYLRGMYRAKGPGDLERLLIELKTLKEEDSAKNRKG